MQPLSEKPAPKFPNGLKHAPDSAHFSLDGLLLAAFAARSLPPRFGNKPILALEAGCGCGGALLGFAMLVKQASCLGFDSESSLVRAARDNAAALNLDGRCAFLTANLANLKLDLPACHGKADILLANPPWREPGKGLRARLPLRQKAHWGGKEALALFMIAGAKLLRRLGIFCMVFSPANLADFFDILPKARLGLRYLLPINSFTGYPANRLLALCGKDCASDFRLAAPLTIHRKENRIVKYTSEAIEFCPWLGQ